MAIDPTRALFVQQEYRFEEVSDLTVKAAYPNAAELEISTNLDQASALIVANSIAAATKAHALGFTVPIDEPLYLEDFDGSPPRYTVTSDEHKVAARPVRLESVRVNYLTGATILTVRG